MIFFTDEIENAWRERLQTWSVSRLSEEIVYLESMIDDENCCKSMFGDDIYRFYDLLRDECVRRVKYPVIIVAVSRGDDEEIVLQ